MNRRATSTRKLPEIVRLLFELNADNGTTLMLVTHDSELTQQADRVISLRGGKVVFDRANKAGAVRAIYV